MSDNYDWMGGFSGIVPQQAGNTTAASQVAGVSVPITGKEDMHPVMVRLPKPVVDELTAHLSAQGEKLAPWIRKLVMELVARKG